MEITIGLFAKYSGMDGLLNYNARGGDSVHKITGGCKYITIFPTPYGTHSPRLHITDATFKPRTMTRRTVTVFLSYTSSLSKGHTTYYKLQHQLKQYPLFPLRVMRFLKRSLEG